MSQNKSVKYHILSAIKENKGHISFDELMNLSGLSFIELSSMIGLLLKETRIGLYVILHMEKGDRYRSRMEDLFSNFMDLLSKNFMRERNIGFYASELCISPKYLTTTIKQASGKTPTEWISERTIKEIEHRLRYSQASIKEIAYDLNFSNGSHFGKYFKSKIGMSPSLYRSVYNKNVSNNNKNNKSKRV